MKTCIILLSVLIVVLIVGCCSLVAAIAASFKKNEDILTDTIKKQKMDIETYLSDIKKLVDFSPENYGDMISTTKKWQDIFGFTEKEDHPSPM